MNKRVKQILNWADYGSVGIRAEVKLQDDSVIVRNYDYHEWAKVKQEELEFEMCSIIETRRYLYGLCAWCQSYFIRSTGDRFFKISEVGYNELSSKSGQSHGCCNQCSEKLRSEREEELAQCVRDEHMSTEGDSIIV